MTLEEAKKIIKSECYIADLLDLDRTQMVNTALDTVIEALEEEPQRAKGHWIEERCGMYTCSECGHKYTDLSCEQDGMNFCPNCGAKMAEGSDEE